MFGCVCRERDIYLCYAVAHASSSKSHTGKRLAMFSVIIQYLFAMHKLAFGMTLSELSLSHMLAMLRALTHRSCGNVHKKLYNKTMNLLSNRIYFVP